MYHPLLFFSSLTRQRPEQGDRSYEINVLRIIPLPPQSLIVSKIYSARGPMSLSMTKIKTKQEPNANTNKRCEFMTGQQQI